MSSYPLTSVRFRVFVLAIVVLATARLAVAEEAERTFVVNFPEVQNVQGSVQVEGPTVQTQLVKLAQEIVAPVARSETTALVSAGVLESAGFGSVVLSLAGQVRADLFREGSIGAVLVPDNELVSRVFEENGQMLFPLEVRAAAVPGGASYFSSDQPLHRLGFPRYRVFFYNTTDRPAEVTLYAYLIN